MHYFQGSREPSWAFILDNIKTHTSKSSAPLKAYRRKIHTKKEIKFIHVHVKKLNIK